jgi:hypothetical protein
MDEYNPKAEGFAERLGPEIIEVFPDPTFDKSEFDLAKKPYKNFDAVVREVYGDESAPYLLRQPIPISELPTSRRCNGQHGRTRTNG